MSSFPNGVKRQRTSSVKYEITYGDADEADNWRSKARHKNVNYAEPDSDEFDSDSAERSKVGDDAAVSRGHSDHFPITLQIGSRNAKLVSELTDLNDEGTFINGQDDKSNTDADINGDDDDDDDIVHNSRSRRKLKKEEARKKSRDDDDDDEVVISSEEDESDGSNDSDDIVRRSRGRRSVSSRPQTSSQRSRSKKAQNSSDDDYSEGEEDADEIEEELEMREELADLQDDDDFLETPVRKHLRARKEIDYRIPLPHEVNESSLTIDDTGNSMPRGRAGRGGSSGPLRRLFPITGPFGGSDTVSIFGGGTSYPPGGQGALGGAQPLLGDSDSSDDDMIQPVSGGGATSKNMPVGIVNNRKKPALADTDPLGVDTNIDFSSVGGLDNYINQLKEMITLPLRYPEIYQQFGVTPPRGVLFHGPPGTGKTLMARALAASCSHDGKQITFYMRKGADCLSKWVGEAERQLRVLFEEAKNNQPAIIFFDEIDGLAPVRSSKQEQIHASIVSTLLALMDGMDNRGQVIVIGATNRPDSIDPALRRPGRFDREFYFPLPDIDARKQIISIQTKKWSPPLEPEFIEEIARLTKGYGGADLRALCTESALNAIQRRYPQIYMSNKKLLIDPSTIHVTAVDFMKSVEKIVPSSARSTSSGAAPIPRELAPLLNKSFNRVVSKVDHIVPKKKKKEPLDDALYEVPHNSFKQQQSFRAFQKSRVFRPRLLICGEAGMGQQYLGAAILHHLEGYHVQSFDLGTMYGDATRPPEATIVQLMIEVKRHTPSVVFIPEVESWLATLTEVARTTFFNILQSLTPNEEVLVLGLAECKFAELSKAAKSLFGFSTSNYENLSPDDSWNKENVKEWLSETLEYIRSKPTDYPDNDHRKKRVLEELPEAPVVETTNTNDTINKRQMDRSELQLKNLLKFKLSNLMEHFKNRYKRFRKPPIDDSQLVHLFEPDPPTVADEAGNIVDSVPYRNYVRVKGEDKILEIATGKKFYNMDLDIIEERLWNGFYCSPQQFLKDIKMIYLDAQETGDRERLIKASEMLASTQMTVDEIATNDPQFYQKCKLLYLKYKEEVKKAKEPSGDTSMVNGSAQVIVDDDADDDAALLQETRSNEPKKVIKTDDTADGAEASVAATTSLVSKVNLKQRSFNEDVEMKESEASVQVEIQPEAQMSISHITNGDSLIKPMPPAQSEPAIEKLEESHRREEGPPLPKPELEARPEPAAERETEARPEPAAGHETEAEPELIIDETEIINLENEIADWATEKGLVLEELEQMNAALVDAIWRNRLLWDRRAVVVAVKEAFEELRKVYD